MVGVQYPDSFLANPKNHRSRACLLLAGPSGNVLVDCPPELRLQLTQAKIYDLEAVIITHTHADHVMGMDDLRSICIRDRRAIPVYTYPEYQNDIRRIFSYAFQEYPEGIFVPKLDLRDVQPELLCAGLTIKTFMVMHGRFKVIGLRVNDFAYITDVNMIPPEARAQLNGLKTLVLDAVRYAPHPNHFHFEKALEVAQEIGAENTYLTHLSHDYDHDADEAKLPVGIKFAYDGLKIEI